MYIKIRVFSIKFVNKYYSNYDPLQRTCTLLVFPTMKKNEMTIPHDQKD